MLWTFVSVPCPWSARYIAPAGRFGSKPLLRGICLSAPPFPLLFIGARCRLPATPGDAEVARGLFASRLTGSSNSREAIPPVSSRGKWSKIVKRAQPPHSCMPMRFYPLLALGGPFPLSWVLVCWSVANQGSVKTYVPLTWACCIPPRPEALVATVWTVGSPTSAWQQPYVLPRIPLVLRPG